MQQALEQVCSPFVADAEAAVAEKPGERALHYPAMPSQSLGGVDPAAGDPRRDASGAEGTA